MKRHLGIDIQHDVATAFVGKLWAYTAVISHDGWALGVAVANEPGYSPVNPHHYHTQDMEEAYAEADRLNATRDISMTTAMEIVSSSMAAGRIRA